MKCPFCGEELIEGNLQCPNCRRLVIDFDYHENLNRMEEKYSKSSLLELSREELTFEEIITITHSLKGQTIMAATERFQRGAVGMEHSPTSPDS